MSAVAYLASYLSRAKFLSVSFVVKMLQRFQFFPSPLNFCVHPSNKGKRMWVSDNCRFPYLRFSG